MDDTVTQISLVELIKKTQFCKILCHLCVQTYKLFICKSAKLTLSSVPWTVEVNAWKLTHNTFELCYFCQGIRHQLFLYIAITKILHWVLEGFKAWYSITAHSSENVAHRTVSRRIVTFLKTLHLKHEACCYKLFSSISRNAVLLSLIIKNTSNASQS